MQKMMIIAVALVMSLIINLQTGRAGGQQTGDVVSSNHQNKFSEKWVVGIQSSPADGIVWIMLKDKELIRPGTTCVRLRYPAGLYKYKENESDTLCINVEQETKTLEFRFRAVPFGNLDIGDHYFFFEITSNSNKDTRISWRWMVVEVGASEPVFVTPPSQSGH